MVKKKGTNNYGNHFFTINLEFIDINTNVPLTSLTRTAPPSATVLET
jgi:hypothetical protein